jgi:hypothetical protein
MVCMGVCMAHGWLVLGIIALLTRMGSIAPAKFRNFEKKKFKFEKNIIFNIDSYKFMTCFPCFELYFPI